MAIFCIPPLPCHNNWLSQTHYEGRKFHKFTFNKAHLLMEMHSRWLPHEAGWENAKSVQSSHLKYIWICSALFQLLHDSMCYFIVLMSSLFYNVEKSKNKEILGLCADARPCKPVSWSSRRTVILLMFLPEGVWNSVVRTDDFYFSTPVLWACVFYHFAGEPLLLLDVSTSQ